MQTTADRPETRLLKTKMFTEQLIVRRKKDGPLGSWEAPISQTPPLDQIINTWVDETGNDIVSITTPGMFMQWMDVERVTRLVVTAVMVTYVPAIAIPKPVSEDTNGRNTVSAWEPAIE